MAPPASGLTTIPASSQLAICLFIYSIINGSEKRLSTGISKNPWIWLACKSIVMTWSQPATTSMFATNLAVIGALDLSFLSILAYGKQGITAVILLAEAILQAEMRIRSSIKLSLTSSQPDWMMKTSSSRTDSEILTLVSPFENLPTVTGTRLMLSLCEGLSLSWMSFQSVSVSLPFSHCLGKLGMTIPCDCRRPWESTMKQNVKSHTSQDPDGIVVEHDLFPSRIWKYSIAWMNGRKWRYEKQRNLTKRGVNLSPFESRDKLDRSPKLYISIAFGTSNVR